MNIVAIYGEDYPWDIRIDKLLTGFQEAGHQVLLVCRNLARRPRREDVDGIRCLRVTGPGLWSPVNAAASLPAFFSPVWESAVRDAVREVGADLILARDLPLSPLAVRIGQALGIPVVVDMAENHPAMWRNHLRSSRWKVPALVLKNPALADRLEASVARRADGFMVVVDEMRQRLAALGADRDRIEVVSNTPELDRFAAAEPLAPSGVARGGFVEFGYVGYITRTRGLQQVIRAVAATRDLPTPPRFHVIGTGIYLDQLVSLAAELGVEDRVLFHGWVDFSHVPSHIAWMDVGVIPHLRTEHTDTTIPNKIFDYMACGKPVLVSDARPLARTVEAEDCGLVFKDGDPESLEEAVRTMCGGASLATWGENGRRSVTDRYNWAADMGLALDFVDKVARGTAVS